MFLSACRRIIMNYLIVVAHPDDEVLGAGATIHKLSKDNRVDICIMSSEIKARSNRPDDYELASDINNCFDYLGIGSRYDGIFPNIEMNTVSHLELVKFIEKAIIASKPDIIITHHPSDTNNDHLHTSLACQAAFRIFQRRDDVKPISEMWYMEVPSATEWSLNSSMNRFSPNTFVEIGEEGVDIKLKALDLYRGVKRDFPHPRSDEGIRGLAAYRGAQSGCNFAEAFECVIRRIV